jgi:hypothetical protein
VNEKRIISIYCNEGWTNLFNNLSDMERFPGSSNVYGFRYFYRKGASFIASNHYFLDWDRVDVILDGS